MKHKPAIAHVKDGKVTFHNHDSPKAPKVGPQGDGSFAGHFPTHYNGIEVHPNDREGLWLGDSEVLGRYQPGGEGGRKHEK